MKTPSKITEEIIQGIKTYDNTIENKGSGGDSIEGINEQGRVGWNRFCRE